MIQQLQTTLNQPLPGLQAQMKMAPPTRLHREYEIPQSARESAVMALFYPYRHQHDYHLVFMKRAEDGRAHSGQISFPGGKWEESDRDFIDTALRETQEEIGVSPSDIEVLGTLTELYIPVSNYIVYPAVGYAHQRPNFIPDLKEVAEIIEVPVSCLLEKNTCGIHPVSARGFQFEAPAYKINQYTIWGATAMMVSELSEILRMIE